MLDLRPLVFVNILAFLLLVTAGFARVNDRLPVHEDPLAHSNGVNTQNSVPTKAAGKTVIQEEVVASADESTSLPLQNFQMTEEQQNDTLEDAVLFVDQLPESERKAEELPVDALTVAALGTANTALERTAEKAAEPLPVEAPPNPRRPPCPKPATCWSDRMSRTIKFW